MRSTFKLGGIGVYIHWTFWVLVLLYLLSATASAGLAAGVAEAIFVLSIFACVLLHEFGHSIAAAQYGIRTRRITLYPFGGVASLESFPNKPIQELVIALAGPAVNVAIAALLFVIISLGIRSGAEGEIPQSVEAIGFGSSYFGKLLFVNIALVVFNLLPAFPMDGGRVLRSLLAMRNDELRATEIAARVGRWMALAFSLMGIFYGPLMLVVVAGFVYVAGTAELMQVRLRQGLAAGGMGTGGMAGADGSGQGSPLFRYSASWQGSAQHPWPHTAANAGDDLDEPPTDPWAPRGQHRPTSDPSNIVIDAVEVRRIKD